MTTGEASWANIVSRGREDPVAQAMLLLRIGFTAAPILFGLDKFTNWMTDWSLYLAPWINDLVPGTGDQLMFLVGAVEVAAGVLVAVRPRIGGYVVAAWLAGIIANLLTTPGYYDIALRDFGLLLAALTLARLATEHAEAPASRGRWLDREARSGSGE